MQIVIGVKYKTATKTYFFDPDGVDYKVGTEVIVDTANGPAFGMVAETNKKVEDEQLELPLRKVLRVATQKDKERIEKLKKKATSVLPIIEKKISEAGLQMKVVDVEYSFDESKVLISFTSDARVDFRELLKMLASALKVKIELRKVGARDEVCSVGGLGLCGMPCCCTRFLREPEHITVKMVKQQNLSLSPTKTGGLCGRMMCCLKFEEEMYREFQANLPKVGDEISTPAGKGVVQSTELLKQTVTVKIFTKDDNYTVETFSVEELKSGKRAEKIDTEVLEVSSEQCSYDCKNCNKHNAENSKVDGKKEAQNLSSGADVVTETEQKNIASKDNNGNTKASDQNKKTGSKNKRHRDRHKNNKQKLKTFTGSDGGVEDFTSNENSGKKPESTQAKVNNKPENIQAGGVDKPKEKVDGAKNRHNKNKFWFNKKKNKFGASAQSSSKQN